MSSMFVSMSSIGRVAEATASPTTAAARSACSAISRRRRRTPTRSSVIAGALRTAPASTRSPRRSASPARRVSGRSPRARGASQRREQRQRRRAPGQAACHAAPRPRRARAAAARREQRSTRERAARHGADHVDDRIDRTDLVQVNLLDRRTVHLGLGLGQPLEHARARAVLSLRRRDRRLDHVDHVARRAMAAGRR